MRLPAVSSSRPARSAQLSRALLVAALGLGLGGLALPTGTSAAQARGSAEPAALHGPVLHAAVAAAPTTVLQRSVRASRSRRVVAATWVRPVSAGVNSLYGPRWGRMHKGIDFGAHYGAPIRAVGAGTVVGAGFLASEGGYGRIVLIRHRNGVVTAYAHTSRVFVRPGQHVVAGQRIALVGATGHVTGPHLHFEVRIGGRQVNPLRWLRAHHVAV